jgi:hypothetical protein
LTDMNIGQILYMDEGCGTKSIYRPNLRLEVVMKNFTSSKAQTLNLIMITEYNPCHWTGYTDWTVLKMIARKSYVNN